MFGDPSQEMSAVLIFRDSCVVDNAHRTWQAGELS
jgi:hypothetical protein